jgi:exodeoxyribonuclease V gamma subunit
VKGNNRPSSIETLRLRGRKGLGGIMPLILVEEDRLEDLAAACFLRLDQEQSEAPFLQETTVIVSGANQGRWFQLHQARSRGISSGLQLPFPWKFVEEELVRSGFLMREGRIDRDWIFARIFACLLDGSISTELGIPYPVDSIAGDEGGSALEIRALQLAERIADLYDKYFLHRPEWVEAWLQGENLPPSWSRYRWQVQLLRRVLQGEADTGVRIAGLALHNCLAQGKWLPSGEDTEPLHIFALVNLAPNILRFFLLQAQTRPVIFYHQRRSSAFLGELPRKVGFQFIGAGWGLPRYRGSGCLEQWAACRQRAENSPVPVIAPQSGCTSWGPARGAGSGG